LRVTRHSEQLPAAAWVSGRQASCTTGPQTQTIDEAGISRTTIVDGLGRNSSVTEDGISATTSYSYDALGNLAGVKQGGFFPCVLAGVSYSRAFSYDSLGRLNTACNPESGTTSYSYYGDGSLFTRTDAESRVLTLNYDVLGRLTHRGYSGSAATPAVDYAYVGTADFLSSVASAASTYTWANYDVLGRPATGTQTTPSVGGAAYNFTNLQWSPQGQLRSITYPSGRIVSTTLDAAGRAASVAGKADSGAAQSSYASSISYAAHGGIAGLTTGDMVTRTVTYNTRLQMTQVQQGSLMTLGFTYDATANNGNMTGAQITRGAFGAAQTFTYDAVNRLKTAAEGGTWNQTYVYDAAGNRALTGNSSMANPGWTPQSPDGVSVPFNAKNQWTAVGGYDLAGNTTTLTQTGTSPVVRQTMTYDAESRMTMWSSTSPVGSAAFSYDGDGRRVTKSSAGLTTTYVYDPVGNLAASYGGAAPPAAATGTLYVTQDHLGSTRLITKGGAAVGCHDYVPFGEEITWGRTAGCYGVADTEVRFTGQVHDSETKLEYFGARHMSGSVGRFLTPDPAGNAVADVQIPQSWNLYGYVQNNPLVNIDPTGATCTSVSHPDGSTNAADDGDGKGCAAAGVSATKSGKPPGEHDVSDLSSYRNTFSYLDPAFNTHADPNDKTQVEKQQELGKQVYGMTGSLASQSSPVCGGGAFTYVGGTLAKGKNLSLEGYAFPISYDSKSGFSSGVLFEASGQISKQKSLFNVGLEFNYNYSTGKVSPGGYGFFGKFQSVKTKGFEGGFLLDNEGNVGLYGGTKFGGGFYGKFGGCGDSK
jgi:RHS repeat-associated protein